MVYLVYKNKANGQCAIRYPGPLKLLRFWYETGEFPAADYDAYSLGEDWSSDWGVSDFKSFSTWEELHERHSSSSSDYDSWDSGDTDRDSDW